MNLYNLTKFQLVNLCIREQLDTFGTESELVERLKKTGKYWCLKFVSIQDCPGKSFRQTKQISKIHMVPFDTWVRAIEEDTGMHHLDIEIPLRDYFDAGITCSRIVQMLS